MTSYKSPMALRLGLMFFLFGLLAIISPNNASAQTQYVSVIEAQDMVLNHIDANISIEDINSSTYAWDIKRFKYFETLRDRLSSAQSVEFTLNQLGAILITEGRLPQNEVDELRAEADNFLKR